MEASTHQQQFRKFAFYNTWFNRRLYELAAGLSDADRKRQMGAFFGSIHGTFNHILLADRIWLARYATSGMDFPSLRDAALVHRFNALNQELYGDFEVLAAERRATDAVIQAWVEELSPAILSQPMRYANSKGVKREHPVWLAAAHLFNHQTHHRGQVTTLLFQMGLDPGVTDFLVIAEMDKD